MEVKIEIKSISGDVLFEYTKENNTIKDTLEEAVRRGADLRYADLCNTNLRYADLCNTNLSNANLCNTNLRYADLCNTNLSNANLSNANLRYANLCYANLRNADLRNADLSNANLRNAYLCNAYLCNAYLCNAYLCNADLCNAYLCNADLCNADLSNANLCNANLRYADLGDWGKLQNVSDILTIGAIGSRNGYTTLFHTDKGLFVQCGCFKGTLEEFESKVKETHQGNKHEYDYMAMIEFAKKRFAE